MTSATPGRRPRFSVAERGRALVVPVVAGALFIFLYVPRPGDDRPVTGAVQRITLSQKDQNFQVIPPARGGATGSVWYRPRGPVLALQLRASGLQPHRRYLFELLVDGTIYTVASHAATANGELAIDSTITSFAEGVCVGDDYDPPRSLSGSHDIKFWVKSDGNPVSGTMPGRVRRATGGASLPCHGNGDGNYQYVLRENAVAHFSGR